MSRKAPATPAKSPAAPGRPKDLEKGSAILDAARRLFTTQGFDGASMDQIAAAAGVSKLTVYSHYGDKETLFAEVVKSYCEQQGLLVAVVAVDGELGDTGGQGLLVADPVRRGGQVVLRATAACVPVRDA